MYKGKFNVTYHGRKTVTRLNMSKTAKIINFFSSQVWHLMKMSFIMQRRFENCFKTILWKIVNHLQLSKQNLRENATAKLKLQLY